MSDPVVEFNGLVEFAVPLQRRRDIRHVLFDFDGTLSLIREGWPQVMIPLFLEHLPRMEGESEADVERLANEDIMRLNGKQTIYQMLQLADRIRERGGTPCDPLEYKRVYLERLEERIQDRLDALRDERVPADSFCVHAAKPFLEFLVERGFTLHLASGTDQPYVRREAELLGLSEFFGGRIFGALDRYQDFSKEKVIRRILRNYSISGEQLLAFGDGYVEIENTKQAGGFAIAVASDEANNGSGRFDAWKRQRLLGVGADVVIPDYRDAPAIVESLVS